MLPVHALLLSIALLVQKPGTLLDVPYQTQTPELCGGAAVAMVLRYWGERQIFADDFASLVVPSERGIPTSALADAVRARQWQVTLIGADAREARSQIDAAIGRGQPLIALIEVSPRTYHYVVIAGVTEREIVVHDPARSPFRVLPWDSFDRAWAAAGRWMMLVLPPAGGSRGTGTGERGTENETRGTTPCDSLVDRAVMLAVGEDKSLAEEALTGATRLCPANAGAWRELAGWRFSQQRYREAASLAEAAVKLAPSDAHARELLATSRYLAGDLPGALDAWAPSGTPRIDLINISGADRTHQPVIVDATGLQPRQVLTSESFARAMRRVRALPAVSNARVSYEPLEGGLAKVDVAVSERDPYPKGWRTFAVIGGRAAISQQINADAAGLFGAGERFNARVRWQDERPLVALSFMAPSPSALPGIAAFDVMWERQTYSALIRESRRRAGLGLSDWATSWLRWSAGMAVDRFDSRRFVSAVAGAELRLAGDRVALEAGASEWFPRAGAQQFGTRTGLVAWRSTSDTTRATASALIEIHLASAAAPLAVWEGAGTGSARDGLLRAHPLLDDRVLTGDVFGRRMAHATVEYMHPLAKTMVGAVSIAGFVDAAQAWHRMTPGSSPLFVDAGVGIRLRMPGRDDALRLDVTHGLRGGGARFSVGWVESWSK